MRQDCTYLFLRYREIARAVWNLGFWPDVGSQEIAGVLAFEDAMARLFEGMVLVRVDCVDRVRRWPGGLGEVINFTVKVNAGGAKLRVDRYQPGNSTHEWGSPSVWVGPESCELRFMGFMDWNQLAPRDYRFLEVLIKRLDERPDLVDHLALLELDKCSIWLANDDQGK